jgi:hypoxanthine phosphoribosyltransferase
MSDPGRSSTSLKTPPVGLQTLLRSDQIRRRVRELAEEIGKEYAGSKPLVIAALKGAFVFLADLIRELDIAVEIDFVRLASYGGGVKSSQDVRLVSDLTTPVPGRDVLIVEDIIDTGLSMEFLVSLLRERGAKSVSICALLDKPHRRLADVDVDYVGFTIPDVFVVGYGIDYAEQHRQWPDIYALEETQESDMSDEE